MFKYFPKLNIQTSFRKYSAILMGLALIFGLNADVQALSIAEYVKIEKERENQKYQTFKEQWFDFLNEKRTIPHYESEYHVRKATEEFLIEKGGLRERLGRASQKNTYGFSFSRAADDERQASFHRAHKSIFIDTENIEGSEWLLLFVHEVAHSLDSEMFDSLSVFNDAKTLRQIEKISQTKRELSIEESALLEKWLSAGLDLGFTAEYRAWLLTYLVYEEGIEDATINQSDWLEEIRQKRPANIPLNTYIYRTLSPSWRDPSERLFSSPVVKEALTTLRKEFYNDPNKVKLGQIGKLINQF